VVLALLLATLVPAVPAAAAPARKTAAGRARPAPASAPAPSSGEQVARTHFAKGEKAFSIGRFAEALEAYEKAYEALPLPAFVFNIAQCHRNLGQHERAIFFYRRYLALEPNPPNRGLVQELISEEQLRLDDEEAAARRAAKPVPPIEALGAPAPVEAEVSDRAPPPAPEDDSTPLLRRWWVWGIVGGVVVTGVTAALLIERRGPEPSASLGVVDAR
jgi:tetratricopeptide (TPR) repeat protein